LINVLEALGSSNFLAGRAESARTESRRLMTATTNHELVFRHKANRVQFIDLSIAGEVRETWNLQIDGRVLTKWKDAQFKSARVFGSEKTIQPDEPGLTEIEIIGQQVVIRIEPCYIAPVIHFKKQLAEVFHGAGRHHDRPFGGLYEMRITSSNLEVKRNLDE
jgi:hypothetical protein